MKTLSLTKMVALENAVQRKKKENEALQKEVEGLQKEVAMKTLSLESIVQADDHDLFRHYTGIDDYVTFNILHEHLFAKIAEKIVYIGTAYNERARMGGIPTEHRHGRPSKLSKKNETFMVLCRLRRAFDETDLANRFGISCSSVSRIWRTWLHVMDERLTQLPIWPDKTTVQQEMPEHFRSLYPSTRAILDSTEIFVEVSSSTAVQSATFSSYKHHNTAKSLVAISPNGSVTFVSDLYGGRTSDKAIAKDCGIIEMMEIGDSVMADRGFEIEEMLRSKGISLNVPPFMSGRAQLSAEDETKTRRIASIRVDVESAIGRIKCFRLLSLVFPMSMHRDLNRVWKVCCYLSNFLPKLRKQYTTDYDITDYDIDTCSKIVHLLLRTGSKNLLV